MSTPTHPLPATDVLPCTGPNACARRVVTLEASPSDARRAAERALRETSGLGIGRLAGAVDDRADGFHAAFAVAFGLFTDDVDVHVGPGQKATQSVVTLRSVSRVGRNDLGVNTRRLDALVGALTRR